MKTNKKIFTETIGTEVLSKTIRNSLVPTETTKINIEKNGLITDDQFRAEKRASLKEIMDNYYRFYIEKKLSESNYISQIEWKDLFEAIEAKYKENNDKTKKELLKIQKEKRTEIYRIFYEDEDFKNIFSAKLISDILPNYIRSSELDEEKKEDVMQTINIFNNFTSSLSDFWNNRKNVFSPEDIHTSVCHRIVNDNAQIFYQNLLAFEKIKKDAFEEIKTIEDSNWDLIGEWKLIEIFNYDYYGMLMNQKGIRHYNDVCGVINMHMNLFCQKYKKNKAAYRMRRLHKQILSIDESTFTIPKMFENDEEVYKTINTFFETITEKKIIERVKNIADNYETFDDSKIYISNRYYETLSIFMTGNWKTVEDSLMAFYDKNIVTKSKAKDEKIKKAIKNDSYRSLSSLNDLVKEYNGDKLKNNADDFIKSIKEKIFQVEICKLEYTEKSNLIENEQEMLILKEKLDLLMEVYHWLKVFIIDEEIQKDNAFYLEVEDIYNELEPLISIYNKVRNYATQKPYKKEKIKLNFGIPTLAKGWSKSKEYDNNTIILLRDNKYYLAIFNPKNKPDKKKMEGHLNKEKATDYKKMVYRLLPGVNKMLPKVFLSKKGIAEYNPSNYILDGYELKKHVKSQNGFDINFCHDLIDYFKDCLNKHSEYRKFEFKFTNTEDYNDISEFYNEVEKQGYKIEWTYLSQEDVDTWEKNNSIYMFQIYNKDFSDKSKGKDSIHTMYLKNLFSEENLKDIVLKLDGEAELFFRKSSIQKPIVHKKGSILVNRTYKEGEERKQIKDNEYREIYNYLNNKNNEEISKEAMDLIKSKKVEYFVSDYDITKDYRYSVDQYFLHLPIKINFKSSKYSNVNEIALKNIAKSDDMHIVGIDRGERNLIYVSVIDLQGNIIEQKNFNIINGVNYKEKLRQREIERDRARKNWREVGKIKELKEGYLSLVVHEIAQLIVKYNAIVVMEDLNRGFKRGRFKVERQVYQKFENLLISKLHYLIDKNLEITEEGGLLRGYQMTYQPERLEQIGRQCGYIFYVPAAYTSKIDPTTGFVAIFDGKKMEDEKFVMSFKSIRYNKEKDMFAFEFDYRDFETHNVRLTKNEWRIFTNGKRLKREKINGKWGSVKKINLTNEMVEIMRAFNLNYLNGEEILLQIEKLDQTERKNICRKIKELVRYIVQMRNSLPDNEEDDYDEIISPVLNDDGEFFDSSNYKESARLPKDADANGAYCIALKGLYEVKQIKENWDKNQEFSREVLKIKHTDWFDFIQNKRYL